MVPAWRTPTTAVVPSAYPPPAADSSGSSRRGRELAGSLHGRYDGRARLRARRHPFGADTAAILDATAGPVPGDPTGHRPGEALVRRRGPATPPPLQIAVMTASPTGSDVHPDCVAATRPRPRCASRWDTRWRSPRSRWTATRSSATSSTPGRRATRGHRRLGDAPGRRSRGADGASELGPGGTGPWAELG